MRTTVIKRLSVGRPAREHLHLILVVLYVRHLVTLHIIQNKITGRIVHLDLVLVGGEETLECLVRGIDDEVQ